MLCDRQVGMSHRSIDIGQELCDQQIYENHEYVDAMENHWAEEINQETSKDRRGLDMFRYHKYIMVSVFKFSNFPLTNLSHFFE